MPKFFLIDGMVHEVGNGANCCLGFEEPCTKERCDGIVHHEPVYNGIAYVCDKCGLSESRLLEYESFEVACLANP